MMKGALNVIALILLAAGLCIGTAVYALTGALPVAIAAGLVLGLAALSPRQVKEWERAVLLRLGRFERVLDPESPGSCQVSTRSPRESTCAFAPPHSQPRRL